MWISKKEYISLKKMVENHEKDLREQLKTNCNMRGAIQNILELRKKDTHDYSRMSEKEIEYRSIPNEVRQAVAWALSVEILIRVWLLKWMRLSNQFAKSFRKEICQTVNMPIQ